MKNLFEKAGKNFIKQIDYMGGVAGLVVFSIIERLFGERRGNKVVNQILIKQIFFTGWEALFIITIIAILLGLVITIQTTSQLTKFGAENLIGKILIITLVRELGPILTAIIIVGRSGTAIATEIGNMTVAHEIEALESMGIDTLKYIMFPRLIGVTIATIGLTVYFAAFGILGGIILTSLQLSIPLSKFFNILFSNLKLLDILILILKSAIFGAIIATIPVYHGFKIRMSSTEVPQAATKSVVRTLIYIFIFNSIITAIFYI